MPTGEVIKYVSCIVFGFLLGSVPFCRIIPLAVKKIDVCEVSDDGNPGAFNAFKTCGKFWGSICLLFDLSKGFLPVLTAYLLGMGDSMPFAAIMFAPVAGHAIGLFNGFRGGKCIATAFGVAIATLFVTPIGWILAAAYIVTAILLKMSHSLSSIVSFSVFGASALVLALLTDVLPVGVGFAAISCVAIYKHAKRPDSVIERSADDASSAA